MSLFIHPSRRPIPLQSLSYTLRARYILVIQASPYIAETVRYINSASNNGESRRSAVNEFGRVIENDYARIRKSYSLSLRLFV